MARRGRDWPVKTASTFAARGKPTERAAVPAATPGLRGRPAGDEALNVKPKGTSEGQRAPWCPTEPANAESPNEGSTGGMLFERG